MASVLTADCQFHGPWNAEVAWGLEDDVVGPQSAVAGMNEGVLEGEVSDSMLMGSGDMMG